VVEGVTNGELTLPVYVSEIGEKPLIVLHELSGMIPSFICTCHRLANEGFKVYAPLLFNKPFGRMNAAQSAMFCVSAEFRSLFGSRGGKDQGRPFTAWLLHLVREVARRHPGRTVGAVGLCLTGGFALATIAEPGVGAAAACEPAFPFFRRIATLGLSKTERDRARARAATLPPPCAKGYRYSGDRACRESHMRAAQTLLGDAFERFPDLSGSAHSTLTTDTASEAVFQDVLQFLNARL
jgi:hypothetical protein